uniref:Ovule protein n=1 Tax=Ascaris lumbricoides TaxID=6252 RepID=A0A9J2QAQ6_ASCLU
MSSCRILVQHSSLLRCTTTFLRKHTLSGDAYQFLQKSEIPSYHFQKSLRRLPIPKLERTCERSLFCFLLYIIFISNLHVIIESHFYRC